MATEENRERNEEFERRVLAIIRNQFEYMAAEQPQRLRVRGVRDHRHLLVSSRTGCGNEALVRRPISRLVAVSMDDG